MSSVENWSYAFDFAANDCRLLDCDHETELSDDDVWSVGADGGGDYLVVLTDGRVAVWFHEEEVLEPHTRFDSLDVFVWTMVRYHAVRSGPSNSPRSTRTFVRSPSPGSWPRRSVCSPPCPDPGPAGAARRPLPGSPPPGTRCREVPTAGRDLVVPCQPRGGRVAVSR
ncbi:hypothetical protein ABZY16_05105 [Streptomyces sp. NPDC006553]|uniref:hypothetical protein n=1 Tax=Streptomyces sp. NPDC006553 TaxID=3157180 RepID=UPI0033B2AF15